ncbi:MAG: hypothetical protein AAF518_20550 [Spirochaetota bacterium]
MQHLSLENFSIHVTGEGSSFGMKWKGKSEFRNPSEILNPYLDETLGEIGNGSSLTVDFTELDFMNSSTFPAILHFMKKCSQMKLETKFQYKGSSEWQAASFKPIQTIGAKLSGISFESK